MLHNSPNAVINVLFLEDEDADRMATLRMLRDQHAPSFNVHHVTSVAEALVVLRNERPDIVLTDLCVTDSQGLPTFMTMYDAAPEVPFVVLSGMSEQETAIAAVRHGAQDFLVKNTITSMLLTRTLSHALARHRGEVALRESEQRFQLAVNGANDGLWDWRFDGGIYFSPRWCAMLGYHDDARPRTPEQWFATIHRDDIDAFTKALDHHLSGRADHFEQEHRIRRADGMWQWVLTRGLAVRDDDGRTQRMAGSQTDISARKSAEERLRHEALHDNLTGLANRALCLDRIDHAIARAQRNSHHKFALLFIDLDRFKVVNDSLGHNAGDELLQAFARRGRRLVRPGDTFARLGGDEFCVVLDPVVDTQDAERVADRIYRSLKAPFTIHEREVFVTASIGICNYEKDHESAEHMLRAADVAMYSAKSAGQGRHRTFDATMSPPRTDLLDMETELRRALDNRELALVFQPIVQMQDRDVTSVEALLRWHNGQRGLISPAEFVPLAEKTGLIVPIGRWVIDAAVRTAGLWINNSGSDKSLSVSVNVSAKQLHDTGLVDHIGAVLDEVGMPPSQLVLELTESVLLEHTKEAIAMLEALRSLGVRIHLDDFGTGFCSLRYLQRLPIDRLKIDRTFIAGIQSRREDREIVRTIVDLGHQLGKSVIAEGIESEGQHEVLLEMGCGYAQGFLYGRPAALLPSSSLAA